jgi:hypothetical protein
MLLFLSLFVWLTSTLREFENNGRKLPVEQILEMLKCGNLLVSSQGAIINAQLIV